DLGRLELAILDDEAAPRAVAPVDAGAQRGLGPLERGDLLRAVVVQPRGSAARDEGASAPEGRAVAVGEREARAEGMGVIVGADVGDGDALRRRRREVGSRGQASLEARAVVQLGDDGARGAEPGAAHALLPVLARSVSSGAKTIGSRSASPRISACSACHVGSPTSPSRAVMVVRLGDEKREKGMSSKPATESSSGTRTPSSSRRPSSPSATTSLNAIAAVAPVAWRSGHAA